MEDDLGRPAVTRDDARMLITERRENEARKARKFEEVERQAIELDQQRRSQIWAGLTGEPDSCRSVLEDSLSNSGTVFHPIQHVADES